MSKPIRFAHEARAEVLEAARWYESQRRGLRAEFLTSLVPPPAEQAAIEAQVEDALRYVDALSVRTDHLEAMSVAVERAALAKAFRGELVPQDPDDEPVSVLLERIRAARAAEPVKVKRGRGAKATKATPAMAEEVRGNGHDAKAEADESMDLIVAALQQGGEKMTAAVVAVATGVEAAKVKTVLRELVDGGQVRVHGKARGTSYEWIA